MVRTIPILLMTASLAQAGSVDRPPIAGQATFLYYDDLAAASHFYEDVLGLEKTFDLDWVHIFRLSADASIGLVNATRGAHRPSADKPVMVSLVVALADVDRWYDYLKGRGVDVGAAPQTGADGHIRAFSFKDPEGYTLEVFAWATRP
jgi:catechol 2,3-dioxygenase-like lactoylglutathione lyase family enzyme